MANELRNFLALSYDELEDMNLQAKESAKTALPCTRSRKADSSI